MDVTADPAQIERGYFQEFLDAAFPRGGACTVLETRPCSPRARATSGVTGRLLCSDARPVAGDGCWEHEILIDSRRSEDEPAEVFRVWISHLGPHPVVSNLWEAEAVAEEGDGHGLLRIQTTACGPTAATRQMRSAVTRVHAPRLFPDNGRPLDRS